MVERLNSWLPTGGYRKLRFVTEKTEAMQFALLKRGRQHDLLPCPRERIELQPLKDIAPDSYASYHVLFATTSGLESLRSETKFDEVAWTTSLDSSFKCFGSDSRYFAKAIEGIDKTEVEKMCRTHGSGLTARNPLGFGTASY